MKQVTKEVFYDALMAEKRDVIAGDCTHHIPGQYYPYTVEKKYRHTASLFGKIKYLGYVNGKPEEQYFLNND